MTEMSEFADIEEAAPELAARMRAVLAAPRPMFLGTIRQDGSPRISPVEAHVVGGSIVLALVPRSQKAADLAHDPRVVLQSVVTHAEEPETELKIRGRAVVVDDADRRERVADAIEGASGWRPTPSWIVVSVAVDAVAILQWRAGDMTLTRWDAQHGIRGPDARRLDMTAGAYISQ